MEGSYEVTWDGQTVGMVDVKREGLYCRIVCRCRMVDNQVHRLCADGDKMGVLIPENGQLILETRVAAKRLKAGCSFSLDEKTGEFIPIRQGEPFGHLDKVRMGRLVFREGEPGLLLE